MAKREISKDEDEVNTEEDMKTGPLEHIGK